MGSINLQGLIDEVLGMVRNRQRPSGDEDYNEIKKREWLSNEAYNADLRKRNTLLETGQQTIAGRNELEGITNAGAVARQGLANTGATDVANINAGAHRYGAERTLEGTRHAADQGFFGEVYKADVGAKSAKYTGETEKIKAAMAIGGDTTIPMEQRQPFIDFLKSYATTEKNGLQGRQGLADEQPPPAPGVRPTLMEEAPAAITPRGNAAPDNGFLGKNPPMDFNAWRKPSIPTAPQITTPATGFGGSVGRGFYGFTHPDEPIPMTGVESPVRKATDRFVFDTAPTAVANTAIGAARGIQEFGQNVSRGYDEEKAAKAKKKRKLLENNW